MSFQSIVLGWFSKWGKVSTIVPQGVGKIAESRCHAMITCSQFFSWNSTDILIIINNSTKSPKIIKVTNRSLDHLATTTNISVSWRRAAVLAPPSTEPGKACHSRACCSRQTGSHRAKAPKDQRTRAANIINNDNHRLEETDLKPHQWLPKPNKSEKIHRTHESMRPPLAQGAPPERG
jgi:hypothetical protein